MLGMEDHQRAQRHTQQFHIIPSFSLETNITIKILTLEGSIPRSNFEQLYENPILKFAGRNLVKFPDLVVEAVIADNGENLHIPVWTSYKHFTRRFDWNEWLTLPIKYSDLPRRSVLCLTVYDCNGPKSRHPVGGTTVNMFGKSGLFHEGQLDLRLWPDEEADREWPGTTPGKSQDSTHENFYRLTKLTKKYREGKIPKVDWLDPMTFAEVEKANQRDKQSTNAMFLVIEFQRFHVNDVSHQIIYYERGGQECNKISLKSDLIRVYDPEINMENLLEAKHHKLARSQRTNQSEKELMPNTEMRNRLNEIINTYPPTQTLSSDEKDNIWRFRYYLSNQKKALTKFVKCVNWNVAAEASQALEMIHKWSPIDVEDALELLGPGFHHPEVRQYAVSRMRQAKDEDLCLYLLQLVQALKYEKFTDAWLNQRSSTTSKHRLSISHSGSEDQTLNESGTSDGSSLPPIIMKLEQSLTLSGGGESIDLDQTAVSAASEVTESSGPDGGLAGFLIERACRNSAIANYLYWYLVIECEEQEQGTVRQEEKMQERYHAVLRRLKEALGSGPPEWKARKAFLDRQQVFVDKIVHVIKAVARESGNRKKKIERLQALLGDSENKFNFVKFDPMEFPLDPTVRICGIVPDKASLFKSSLMPARLTFLTETGSEYVAIFKHGDDLRQDQLILQIITLMDKILRQENLDLKLTPYRALATSTKHGLVQYVDSLPVADVLQLEGSIQNYFRKYNPSETGPYGISSEVMDTYIKSCAGYCVITYLLGIGDRHLDNLLLNKSGNLLHVDFGYILGRDPKPMPPPMKLSKEMIEAFGGIESDQFLSFRKQCYTAFLHLRRYANLILNLFSLMVDASIPDIALEPDKTVRKVQDKFMLQYDDEEAVKFMQSLIDVSAAAVMAAVVEKIHKFAQFWRN